MAFYPLAILNIYSNDLIVELNRASCGCLLGDRLVNNLNYADDMCVLAPSIKALRELLHKCEVYSSEHDILYNAKKTKCMHFASRLKLGKKPPIFLSGELVEYVNNFTYLGHKITSDLKDNSDIEHQRRLFRMRGNMLLRKFGNCSFEVKSLLFKSFCYNVYCCHLWCSFTQLTMNSLKVIYNNLFRRLFGYARDHSARTMFVQNRLMSFYELHRNIVYKFRERLNKSNNSILKSDVTWKSILFKYWSNVLY